MTEIEGAMCDLCGTKIGPRGCCSTINKLYAENALLKLKLEQIQKMLKEAFEVSTAPSMF